jgi:hypothetical protein
MVFRECFIALINCLQILQFSEASCPSSIVAYDEVNSLEGLICIINLLEMWLEKL